MQQYEIEKSESMCSFLEALHTTHSKVKSQHAEKKNNRNRNSNHSQIGGGGARRESGKTKKPQLCRRNHFASRTLKKPAQHTWQHSLRQLEQKMATYLQKNAHRSASTSTRRR